MTRILFYLFWGAALLGASEVRILEREIMAPERFILNPGEKRIFHPQLKKESGALKEGERLGLRVLGLWTTEYIQRMEPPDAAEDRRENR